MKQEDLYKKFLKASGGKPVPGLEEPDTSESISSGTWEDSLRKWKIQIRIWLKTADDSPSKSPMNTMPLTLADSTTIAEVVQIQKDFLLMKVFDPPTFAFLHTSR